MTGAEGGEEGRRLRSLIDSLPDGVVEIGEDGVITFASRRLEEMFGYAPAELSGRLVEDLVPEPLRRAHVGHRGRHFSRGAGRPLGAVSGLRGRRKDGETFPCSIALGAPGGGRAVAVLRDETERSRLDEALRLRDAALAAAANAVVITDTEGIIQWVNPAFSAITGYASAEAVGQSTRLFKSGFHSPEFYRKMWETIANGRVWTGSVVNRRKDGALYHEEMTIAPVSGPDGRVAHFVAVKQDDTPRWRAEESLRKLNRAYRALSECNQALIRAQEEKVWVDRMCRIITEFGGYRTAWVAYRSEGRLGLESWDGSMADVSAALPAAEAVAASGGDSVEQAGTSLDGARALLPMSADGKVFGVLGIHSGESDAFDAGELRLVRELAGDMAYGIASLRAREENRRSLEKLGRTEEQLRHAQKMETAGRLAGGIAHDFNNLLTVILAACAEAAADLPETDGRREVVEMALGAARRGAELTRQLLAFSRRQVLVPQRFDLSAATVEMSRMLKRTLGEEIELRVEASEAVWVDADKGSIEQVLLNLAVNARDAMPRGGCLALRVLAAEASEAVSCVDALLPAGRYALIEVEDSGLGMTEEVTAHIFEPFFTTKESGKGTGLGLSTVYGISRQNRGGICVRSAAGKGTTFTVLLPRAPEAGPAGEEQAPPPPRAPRAEGSVLLVEDDPAVRALAARAVEAAGFSVRAAADPAEALRMAQVEAPQLVVTDVVLPGLSGPELVVRLRRRRPGLRALYVSGYMEHSILETAAEELSKGFLRKPFTPDELVRWAVETLRA
jgi:PAS domain S-box-containing protein